MNAYIMLFIVFAVLNLVGFLWLAIVAFKRSVVWGLLVLLLSPITAIIFSLINWFDARKAFVLYIVTLLLSSGTLIFIYSQVGLGNMQQIVQKMHKGELRPDQAYQLVSKGLTQGGGNNLLAQEVTPATAPNSQAQAKPGLPAVVPAADMAMQSAKSNGQTLHKREAVTPPKPASPQVAQTQPAATPDSRSGHQTKTGSKSKTTAAATQASTDNAARPSPATDPVDDKPAGPIPDPSQVQPDPLAQKPKALPSNKVAVSLSKVSHYLGRYFIITLKSGSQHRGLLRKVDRTKLVLDRKLYGGNFVYRIRKDEIKSIYMLKHIPDEP